MKVAEYLEAIRDIPREHRVYLDETGIDRHLHREHCYAPEGKTAIGRCPGRKFMRKSVVAGQRDGTVLAPMLYDGTMDSRMFCQWFSEWLLPTTAEDDVVILDNASVHSKKKLQALCDAYGRKIIFLPPYSPELNPIEKLWARLKKLLRSCACGFDTLEDAMYYIFSLI